MTKPPRNRRWSQSLVDIFFLPARSSAVHRMQMMQRLVVVVNQKSRAGAWHGLNIIN